MLWSRRDARKGLHLFERGIATSLRNDMVVRISGRIVAFVVEMGDEN